MPPAKRQAAVLSLIPWERRSFDAAFRNSSRPFAVLEKNNEYDGIPVHCRSDVHQGLGNSGDAGSKLMEYLMEDREYPGQ